MGGALRCYLVCYDIADEKRLRKVHRIIKGYGIPWQYSFFFCRISRMDILQMKADLREAINGRDDQILVLDMGESLDDAVDSVDVLGRPLNKPDVDLVII
ncbi:CRISPR-associated endonuclease Cas2 [Slackia piriformis]|uniref:CRISPR-associated endonuclease Cas2 n=1 Tax=Slackia piriformis TaxID=626934 RepID=UPI0026DB50E9|nr:CRISPR-associated endonuclease Cas2 [Slackia piriformis]MDO5023363.1 CRISPR-associated endonuclease Cas2 [Slackia piriformis]